MNTSWNRGSGVVENFRVLADLQIAFWVFGIACFIRFELVVCLVLIDCLNAIELLAALLLLLLALRGAHEHAIQVD